MSNDTIASEVLSASLGGAISAGVLYPLEVLKTKMQAEAKHRQQTKNSGAIGDDHDVDENDDGDAPPLAMIPYARQLYATHGPSVFVHGLPWSSLQSALEKALYFFAYTTLKRIKTAMAGGGNTNNNNAATNLLLGCLAEWAHLPITLPVDAWTTQIQTSSEAPMKLLLALLRKPHNCYHGISAYYVLCFKPALQYTVFEHVKQMRLRGTSRTSLPATEAFVLGMLARTVATVLVFPCVRAKVLMQTNNSTTDSEQQPQQSTWELLQALYRDQGVAGLFQGLGPELTRGVLSAALMLMIKERLSVSVKALLASSPSPSR